MRHPRQHFPFATYEYKKSDPGVTPHDCTQYHFYYVHSGQCDYRQGEHTVRWGRGDMIITNGITPYSPKAEPGWDCVQTRFSFDPQLAHVFDPYFCTDSPLKPFIELRNHQIRLSEEQVADCENILMRINHFYEEEEKAYYNRFLMAFYDLLMFISNLCKETMESNPKISAEKERNVQKMIAFIENYYMQDVTLEQMEAELHMSKYYLTRMFREMTGMTIFDYLRHRRIKQAKLLFYYRKDSTVTDVCYQVGYNNLAHFSRVFKKQVGMSPDQYRREQNATS
ncbi:helix-turn-helix transcriptional regulator [Paenibacillus oceani]|uniref:Helix-turn-helix transcriptional regulator n=1 Tax=Paenibacillus oceani TaxID=2772510 RepID=A0A927CEJ8_9BACL|nr:AraC family transcriptional regulator [Paenibacillus oceani]MBD2866624.1 helix-turn-helix transcriptional regulator [Paenibacillus oceani]